MNELTYHIEGDFLLPDLIPPESPRIGVWGMRRREFLRKHHGGLYTGLLLSGTLNAHLEEIDRLLLFKQCTYPDLRQFLHQARWEHIPNPEITLRVSCAFLQNVSLYSCCCCRFECYNQYPFPQLFASAYSFLFTGTQIALW